MKKYILLIFFSAIMLITNLVSANVVYKNIEYSIDFIIPVSDKVEDNKASWHFISLDKKNKGCQLTSNDLKKYHKKIKDNNYLFGVFKVNSSKEVDCEIYVDVMENLAQSYASYSGKALDVMSRTFQNNLISGDYKGFSKKYSHCGEGGYLKTIGRNCSMFFVLSNGKASLIYTLTHRMGKDVRFLGYGKDFKSFEEVRKIVTEMIARMDFDATYPEGYFTAQLENL